MRTEKRSLHLSGQLQPQEVWGQRTEVGRRRSHGAGGDPVAEGKGEGGDLVGKAAAVGVWNEPPQVCLSDRQVALSAQPPQRRAQEERQPLP